MSIRYKLLLLIVFFTIVATSLSYVLVKQSIEQEVDEKVSSEMLLQLNRAQGVIERFLSLGHENGIDLVVSGFSSDRDFISLFYANDNGEIVTSADWSLIGRNWRDLAMGIDERLIKDVVENKVSRILENEKDGLMDGYISICNAAEISTLRTKDCGFLFYRIDLDYHLNHSLSKIMSSAGYGLIALAILAAMLFFLIHKSLTNPVEVLLKTVRGFAAGNRSYRSGLKGNDEIGSLGNTIDSVFDYIETEESLLRLSEETNKAIVDSAGLSIIRTDSQGIIQTFNRAAERQLGYRAEDIIGKNSFEILHDPSDMYRQKQSYIKMNGVEPDSIKSMLGLKGTDNPVSERECHYLRKDGTCYPVLLYITALYENGVVNGFVILGYDLTERRKSEASSRLAEKVFESTHEAIVIADAHRNIIDVNSAYNKTTGYQKADVLGNPILFSVLEQNDNILLDQMWDVVGLRSVWSGEFWQTRKNGEIYPVSMTVSAIVDTGSTITHYVTVFTDITDQKQRESILEDMAFKDALTGLPNRALFNDRITSEIRTSERYGNEFALLFIDLNKFKVINDTLGHDAGDDLLIEVSNRLRNAVRKSDTVARLAGDEFVIIVPHIKSEYDAISVAEKIIASFKVPVLLGTELMTVGISMGISIFPGDGKDLAEIMKSADQAMYLSKKDNHGYVLFKSIDKAEPAEIGLPSLGRG